jgi:MFS family permease
MVLVAFPLLALAFTHNALLIAGVLVAGRFPALVVALPAGALADRVNRRQMVVAIEVLRFLAVSGFVAAVVTGADGLPAIYTTVFVLGTLDFVFEVTSAACLPTMVAKDQLVTANARMETVDVTAEEMVGKAIGGAAFAVANALPFVVDAVSFAVSARLLRRAIPDNPPMRSGTTLRADLRSGMEWFLRTPLLRLLAGLIASFAFCQALVLGVLVLYATEDLHLTRSGYGLLLGVAAIGNFVGAVGASRIHTRLRSAWSIVIAGGGAAMAYPIMAVTRSPFLAAGALALETGGVMLGGVAARSLRQAVVPGQLQGRVASAYMMMILAALTLGGLAGGLLTAQFGLRPTFVLAGCLQVVVVAVAGPRFIAQVRHHLNTATFPAPVATAA